MWEIKIAVDVRNSGGQTGFRNIGVGGRRRA